MSFQGDCQTRPGADRPCTHALSTSPVPSTVLALAGMGGGGSHNRPQAMMQI